MHARALEISWHESASIWAIDAAKAAGVTRLVTAGGDKTARVWRLRQRPCSTGGSGSVSSQADVEFICDLRAHTSTVNVARFAPGGQLIATAADGGEIALWAYEELGSGATSKISPSAKHNPERTASKHSVNTGPAFGSTSVNTDGERWGCARTLRGHTHDVLDLSWSQCGSILASASVDNSIMIWNVSHPTKPPVAMRQHSNFVQGVAFHPGGSMIASLGNDRFLRIFTRSGNAWKLMVTTGSSSVGDHRLFVDDMHSKNVFRRLSWSPDGNLLVCPSGVEAPPGENKKVFAVHVFSRHALRYPIAQCGGLPHPAIAVRFCPILFELRNQRSAPGQSLTRTPAVPIAPNTSFVTQSVPRSGSPLKDSVTTGSAPAERTEPHHQRPFDAPIVPMAPVPGHLNMASDPVNSDASDTAHRMRPGVTPPPLSGLRGPPEPSTAADSCRAVFSSLPYRMVFAVASTDAIFLYDTESFSRPIGHISGLHLAEHTDLSWAPDGRHIFVSSTDGYASILSFSDQELGKPVADSALPSIMRSTAVIPEPSLRRTSAATTVVAPKRTATNPQVPNGAQNVPLQVSKPSNMEGVELSPFQVQSTSSNAQAL